MEKRPEILLVTAIVLLFACEKKSQRGKVAIVYASVTRGQLLRNLRAFQDNLFSLAWLFWIARTANKRALVVNSDIGMTNAAMTAQLLLDRFKPIQIVFTGICGGIDPENAIGDIVVPEFWVTHDYGLYNQEGFSTGAIYLHLAEKGKPDTVTFFAVDGDLLKIAENVRPELKPILGRTPQIKVGGNGASGNSFIDQVKKRKWLKEKLGAQIVDMESAAVVQVAKINGVPILVVRSCSDLAGGSGSSTAREEMQEFFEVAADNSASFVLEFLRQM